MSDAPGTEPDNQHREDPTHDRDDAAATESREETPAETAEPHDDGAQDDGPQDAAPGPEDQDAEPGPERSGLSETGLPETEAPGPDHTAVSLPADGVPADDVTGEPQTSPATTESPASDAVPEPASDAAPGPVPDPVPDAAPDPAPRRTEDADAETSPGNAPLRQDSEDTAGNTAEDTVDGIVDDARPAPVPAGGTRRLWNLFRPRNRRAEYITAALCVAFGFALAVQVAQSTGDQLASLRQDELVRLLDEVTQRGEQLDAEVANLTAARDDLRSADGQDRAARELAEQRAEYEGILSGRLPAEGPGVVVEIQAGPGTVTAANMFNMLEELRNAGVEAQQVNDVRIVTSSHFEETVDEQARILLDGHLLEPPYRWMAIGDPETVDRALEIPGGALPTLRDAGATAEVTRQEHVVVDATRAPADPEHAEPSEE